ncbi:MAG: hypothetical protein AAGF48_11880 [Pseudomonadota bacterium]
MAMYLTHFKCNYEAWPTDHDAQKAAWSKMIEDANGNVEAGTVSFVGWANNTEGYALLEAASKADVIEICARYWPMFHNEIIELVPGAEAGKAILKGVSEGW